jgi:hypothetical protein
MTNEAKKSLTALKRFLLIFGGGEDYSKISKEDREMIEQMMEDCLQADIENARSIEKDLDINLSDITKESIIIMQARSAFFMTETDHKIHTLQKDVKQLTENYEKILRTLDLLSDK